MFASCSLLLACKVDSVSLYVGATSTEAEEDGLASIDIPVGDTAHFYAVCTHNENPDEVGVEWTFDLDGNGTYESTDAESYDPNGAYLSATDSHVFNSSGQYTVRVKAKLDDGEDTWEGPATCTVTVVKVESVTQDKTIASVNEDITFTATPDPYGNPRKPLDDIEWQKCYKAGIADAWGAWTSVTGTDNTAVLNTSTSGYYRYQARNGANDGWKPSSAVRVISELSVEPAEAYVEVGANKDFTAWTVEGGVSVDVTDSATFTTSNGSFSGATLTASTTPSASEGADSVSASYGGETTDSAHECSLTVVKIDITDSAGGEITGVPTVSVGEKIELGIMTDPDGLSTSNWQWTIEGDKVKDYTMAQASASKTDLSESDLQNEDMVFYWVVGGNPLDVSIACEVEGAACSDDVEFNAQRPDMEYFRAYTDTVAVVDVGGGVYRLTPVDNYPGDIGMVVDIRVTQPTSCWGYYKVVQLIDTVNTRTWDDDTVETLETTGSWFDAFGDERHPAPGVQIGYDEDDYDDTPSMLCFSGCKDINADDMFTVYFMYKPDLSGAIWVPLGKLLWGWYGMAVTTDGGATWNLVTGALVGGGNPLGGDTSEFPEWSDYVDASAPNPPWE